MENMEAMCKIYGNEYEREKVRLNFEKLIA